jgi:hypothetical protein
VITLVAVLCGLGAIVAFNRPPWAIFLGALIAELIVVQLGYAGRIKALRRITANLGEQFPADRFLVGNVRTVGPDDRDVGSVPFTTVILQIGEHALSLWKPGVGSTPFMVIPRADSTIETIEGKPPRWLVVSSGVPSATYLALFASVGLGYQRPEQLRELARDYGTR